MVCDFPAAMPWQVILSELYMGLGGMEWRGYSREGEAVKGGERSAAYCSFEGWSVMRRRGSRTDEGGFLN